MNLSLLIGGINIKKIKSIGSIKKDMVIKINFQFSKEVSYFIVLNIDESKVELQMREDGEGIGNYYLNKNSNTGDIILYRKNGNPIAVIHNVSGLSIQEATAEII